MAFPLFRPGDIGSSGQALREMVRSFTEAEVEPQATWVQIDGPFEEKNVHLFPIYILCITRIYIYMEILDSSMVSTVVSF